MHAVTRNFGLRKAPDIYAHIFSPNYIHLKDIWCTLGFHRLHTYDPDYNKDIKRLFFIACCSAWWFSTCKKYWPKSDDHQNDDIAAPGVTEVVLRLSCVPIWVGALAMAIRTSNKNLLQWEACPVHQGSTYIYKFFNMIRNMNLWSTNRILFQVLSGMVIL